MHFRALVGLLALFLIAFYVTARAQEVNPPPPSSVATLLASLKAVVEQNSLFDPYKTANLLALSVGEPISEQSDAHCANGATSWRSILIRYPLSSTWYQMQPQGIHEDLPAFAINRASRTGDPKITYYTSDRTLECGLQAFLKNTRTAQLDLSGLPGFACVTPSDVTAMGWRYQMGTDGVSVGTYAHVTDDAASSVTIFFRAMASCATGVSIGQNNDRSLRWQRANAKYQECIKPIEREYCQAHPGITFRDGDKMDEMEATGIKVCGSFESFYQREPRNGEIPPPTQRFVRRAPCDGI
jgi:hypothetical protein